MRKHGITTSIISLANPWLDFLAPDQAAHWAEKINDDLEAMCSSIPQDAGRHLSECYSLFAFGALPLSAATADVVVKEVGRLKKLKHLRGIIMGTAGLGKGLDDPALDPIWAALQNTDTLTFLHPHYGLSGDAFGGEAVAERYGHVLPLALGFPLETTIAVTRMFLAGVFDRFPTLKILLAHSGGTLPFLAGRIQSCVAHERKFVANGGGLIGPVRNVWDVLKQNIYLDAVIYGDVGLKAAVQGTGSVDRVLFGKQISSAFYRPSCSCWI
jgi:predicted TIM-barrel fold metal-dependent hydrolase